MSQPDTSILPIEESFAIVERWRTVGPTEEELNDFIKRVSDVAIDSDMVNKFLKRVSEVGKLGGRIDQTMRQLTEQMVWLLPDHWVMVGLVPEWKDFRMVRLDYTYPMELVSNSHRLNRDTETL
jgi:hypothetical protein